MKGRRDLRGEDAMAEVVTKLEVVASPSIARIAQDQILCAEAAAGEALSNCGHLLANLMMASKAAGQDDMRIQTAINRIVKTAQTAALMRVQLFGCHGELRRLLDGVDAREMGWGDAGDSPDWLTMPEGSLTETQ